MTHLAVLRRFLCLHKRNEQRSWEWGNSTNRLEMEQVWEAEEERAGGLSPGWTLPTPVQTKPSPPAWLLGLGNRTFVGKRKDCFKDTWWQYQFFFVMQNTWTPSILFNHLDRGTRSRLSLAPWYEPWGSSDGIFSKSQEKKCLLPLHLICWRAQKIRHGKSNCHSSCPGSSVDVGFSIHPG